MTLFVTVEIWTLRRGISCPLGLKQEGMNGKKWHLVAIPDERWARIVEIAYVYMEIPNASGALISRTQFFFLSFHF